MRFLRFATSVLLGFGSAYGYCASPSPHGWWSASNSPLTINGNRPVFGESWYVIARGSSVCAVRANHMNGTLSGMRIYRGMLENGHMALYKGPVILGAYSDDPQLAKFIPVDPYHFFVGSASLVLRLQLPGERANRFILLWRHGDVPDDPDVLKAAARCNVPN
ncbi:MAG: hypothetical protein V4632_22380 [Pseudomonadota bacterium]